MEHIIKRTNRCAIVSFHLLVYWVFIFISITVFDFKVFKENLTEIFFLSVIGIFVILTGSVVVNIMSNLTKISTVMGNRNSSSELVPPSKRKKSAFFLWALFPALFCFLFVADFASTMKREKLILSSAKYLLDENQGIISKFTEYSFNREYINQVSNSLRLIEKIDEDFPNVDLIISDEIEGKNVHLKFDSRDYSSNEKTEIRKVKYIFSSSKEEREYLQDVFFGQHKDYRFSADGRYYELFYPVMINSKIVVLYLSDRKGYGKIGS